jgi:hypothetical protein
MWETHELFAGACAGAGLAGVRPRSAAHSPARAPRGRWARLPVALPAGCDWLAGRRAVTDPVTCCLSCQLVGLGAVLWTRRGLHTQRAAVQELQVQLERLRESARAEIQTARHRAEADVTQAREYSLQRFATGLLDVVDNLERARVVVHDALPLSLSNLEPNTAQATLCVVPKSAAAWHGSRAAA